MRKIVFFGTPDYVLPVLERINRQLRDHHKSPIVAVVTQNPKPTGRKQILEYSAVDKWAHEKKVPIYYKPTDLIENNVDAELGILAAYGAILPEEVVNYFPKGILNIHPSLLSKYKGASPIQAQMLKGEQETGVTIIKLDDQMDHGPIVTSFRDEILPEDSVESLRARLFEKSANILMEVIEPYLSGKIKPKEQNHEDSTYTRLITKEFGLLPGKYLIDLMEGKEIREEWEIKVIKDYSVKVTPEIVVKLFKALSPWPGIWTFVNIHGKDRRLKLLDIGVDGNKLLAKTVQLEGKNPVSWESFKVGYPDASF